MSKNKDLIGLAILLVIGAVLLVIMVGMLVDSFVGLGQSLGFEARLEKLCLESGYTGYEIASGSSTWIGYCTRIVNGNSEAVEMGRLNTKELGIGG